MSNQKRCEVDFDWVDDSEGSQAVLFGIGDREVWVPRSVIYEIDQDGRTVDIAEWKAIELELV